MNQERGRGRRDSKAAKASAASRFLPETSRGVPRDPDPVDRARRAWAAAVLLGLAASVAILYAPVRHYDFVQVDDPVYVSENANVVKGLSLPGIGWAFTTRNGGYWIPLTWLSYMADVQLFGMNPGALHATNVLLHIANTLLLFLVLWRMTGGLGRSAFVAALFGVHPLHVESVAWITERKDVLSTLFLLLSLWAYVSYARRPGLGRYLPVLMWFTLGLMSKPMLVTFPFALLLLDVWPLQRGKTGSVTAAGSKARLAGNGPIWMRLVREKAPMILLAAAFGAVTFMAQGEAVSGLDVYPFSLRVENALVSYVSYLTKMTWPTGLVMLYPFPTSIPFWSVAGSAFLLVVVSAFAIVKARQRPYVAAGWFWYLGTLVPVIGLVQVGVQAMADRFTYVPLIGIFIIVAWGGWDLLRHLPRARSAAVGAAFLIIASCAVVARSQVQYWKNNVTLWTRNTEVTLNLDAYGAHISLGKVLRDQGRFDEAAMHFAEAAKVRPDDPEPHYEMGLLRERQEKADEAIASFEEAVRLNPGSPEAQKYLAAALSRKGKIAEAIQHLTAAVRFNPGSAELNYDLGLTWASAGKMEEAVAALREAVRIQPDFADAQNQLGAALATEGKTDEAIVHATEAVRLKPDLADAQDNLGAYLARQSRFSEALPHLIEATRLNPDYERAHMNLALVFANTGRFADAARELKEVLRINPANEDARRALNDMTKKK